MCWGWNEPASWAMARQAPHVAAAKSAWRAVAPGERGVTPSSSGGAARAFRRPRSTPAATRSPSGARRTVASGTSGLRRDIVALGSCRAYRERHRRRAPSRSYSEPLDPIELEHCQDVCWLRAGCVVSRDRDFLRPAGAHSSLLGAARNSRLAICVLASIASAHVVAWGEQL